jgi:glycine dehydrogenase subunit 1
MPFVPHTEEDVKTMLEAIGASAVDDLFDEIPVAIRAGKFRTIPDGLNEMEMMRLMKARAEKDHYALNFIGAGAYEHHIPAAVWEIASRGEFMTAYTPYQAEASQGTLQLLYEYQSMMCQLLGMDVSNASLYDGGSALAEAVLMAVRLKKATQPKILIMGSLNPFYRDTLQAIVAPQKIQLIENQVLQDISTGELTAVIIQQPNFFGVIEDVDVLTRLAHEKEALVIGVVNPLAMALLKEPGSWGEKGADIVCGDLQPLGIPLASGGPYAGFLCAKQAGLRQMPGRIVGATVDKDGRRGFTLTLQAREQHIRRGKATSNICTNQGLLVSAVTIYLSLLGFEGLTRVAASSHANAKYLFEKLIALRGISALFDKPFFHEFALKFEKPIQPLLDMLAKEGILAGYKLSEDTLLICATETKTKEELDYFVERARMVTEI